MVKLRIVVADDNPKMLQELVSLLKTEFDIVGTAADGGSARDCIQRYKPDVAVLDLVMPTLNGIELTRQLNSNGHRPCVVICSVERDREIIDAARNAGALGYVFKTRMAKDLIPAVKSVAAGRAFLSPAN